MDARNLIGTKEAAAYVGLAEITLRQLRIDGRRQNRVTPPPFYRIGRKILYSVADLDKWLAAHRVDPMQEPSA